jgi:hypothetical protein
MYCTAEFFAIVAVVAAYKKENGRNTNYYERKNTNQDDGSVHLGTDI